MRKLPTEFENPLDNYILDIADKTAPYFYKMGFNPNTITTLSNICVVLTIILLFQAKYYWAAFFIVLSYFFDCLDGHMARSYKMTSVFGDYYDHISDTTKIVLVLISLYYINKDKFNKVFPLLVVLFIMMSVHFGCQELYYVSDESETLDFMKNLCPVPDKHDKTQVIQALKSTRFFGCGTVFIALAIVIIYYDY